MSFYVLMQQCYGLQQEKGECVSPFLITIKGAMSDIRNKYPNQMSEGEASWLLCQHLSYGLRWSLHDSLQCSHYEWEQNYHFNECSTQYRELAQSQQRWSSCSCERASIDGDAESASWPWVLSLTTRPWRRSRLGRTKWMLGLLSASPGMPNVRELSQTAV